MGGQSKMICENFAKHHESKKPPSRKSRKGGSTVTIEPLDEFGNSNTWMCKNNACKAILSMDNAFCKRCSCCICHSFDENKDPSLWLVCSSDASIDEHYCGLSCHIECALNREKAGVVNLGELSTELDGSYCCFACGKVSCILGYWKKQLILAKEARRVDNLCERVFLSFRLFDGTSRFKDLHKVVEDAKARLESEVGPLDEDSAKENHCFVNRLSVASEVLGLCSLAVEKADEWFTTVSNSHPIRKDGSLPAACKFFFEEVTSSSVVIVLLEISSSSTDDIKGYKLWYCKSRDESYSTDPISILLRTQRRILISNLQPCTEYSFRVMSYTETGDLGHSEAKCFTHSSQIINKKLGWASAGLKNGNPQIEDNNNNIDVGSSSGYKVRNLARVLHSAWAPEQGCNEHLSGIDLEKSYEREDAIQSVEPQRNQPAIQPVEPQRDQPAIQPVEPQRDQPAIQPVELQRDQPARFPLDFDLNVALVPDLNEELFPLFDLNVALVSDENNGCASAIGEALDLVSNKKQKVGSCRESQGNPTT